MIRPAEVFEVERQGFNLRRGVGVAAVMLAPLIVLGVLHQEKYFLSVAFAALFVGLSDPGGEYGYRAPRMALVAVAGALLVRGQEPGEELLMSAIIGDRRRIGHGFRDAADGLARPGRAQLWRRS